MDQREELARLISHAMVGGFPSKPKLIDLQAADAILAAGWEKRSPAGEAVRARALAKALQGIIVRCVTEDGRAMEECIGEVHVIASRALLAVQQPSPSEVEK